MLEKSSKDQVLGKWGLGVLGRLFPQTPLPQIISIDSYSSAISVLTGSARLRTLPTGEVRST